MMSPEEIESLLASLPVRTFAPEVEARLLAAVLAARPKARRWWQHSVPLWQAAAAALLLAVAAGLVTHGGAEASRPPEATQIQTVSPTPSASEAVVPATHPDSAYVLDIRRWHVLAATTQGVPQ